MFRPTATNPNQQRTLRPLYAQHQATPYGGFLDPEIMEGNTQADILPGTVMYRKKGEVFAPVTDPTTQKPFGLAALFKSPSLGIDEVTPTNSNLFTVWVGNNDSLFEVLAPAFDPEGDWTLPEDGSRKLLTANSKGLLTPTGATAENAAAELIDAIGPNKIIVRLLTPSA